MKFIWPALLFLLVVIPVLIVLYILYQRRRARLIAQYGNLGLLQGAMQRRPGARRHLPPALFLAGLTILTVAMARPQTLVSLPRIEGTVMLAFDVSGSMAATDLKPTRMEAAKAAARDFIQRQPSTVQVGIVAFSDSGFSVQAPTNDQDALLAAINRLTPQRGTSLANGITASLKAIAQSQLPPVLPEHYSNLTPTPIATPTAMPPGKYTSSVIVLLSDGENNENPDPMAAAQASTDRGVRIYTVGIGSPTGVSLHVNGFTVFTQLDEPTLKQISQTTGGTYYNAQSEQDLLKIYNNLNPQLIVKPEETEVTSIFAGASILVLLLGGVFSFLWFGRLP